MISADSQLDGRIQVYKSMNMDSALTWIDLTASDRDKIRRVLDLFHEQGTVDEMGLGNLRDAFSDTLFPGTSTIQTRLRYCLFIPWIYQQLERQSVRASQISKRSRSKEIELIRPLKQNKDSEGTIGGRSYESLARLPSSVYWNALVRWNIFQHPQSQGWYHTNFDRLVSGGSDRTTDDPGVSQWSKPNWHPRLPTQPSSFPNEVSFALTSEEASFLQGCIEAKCHGTLLAHLAREGVSTAQDGSFWDDEIALKSDAAICNTIELARRFSLHVEGMLLIYNLLVAERLHSVQGANDERVDLYRTLVTEWANRESSDAVYDPAALWSFAASRGVRVPPLQLRFIERWSKCISELPVGKFVEDRSLRELIANRERQLKGDRARLFNTGRLLDWSGAVGVGRMDFRWYRVRRLLHDLHEGLRS